MNQDRPAVGGDPAEGKESFLLERMGHSQAVRRVWEQVRLVAPTEFTVLITGETGSGKELVAQAIHRLDGRGGKRFVPVDCGSIPPSLIESELFGHERGSFTGADRTRPGKFEMAHGGTLFLDEISNLPVAVQPKLLRALQEKQIWRVGGTHPIAVRPRTLAATNQDLRRLVREGSFRSDLYHRLDEFSITVPPLRERVEDIVYLAERFAALTGRELGKEVKGLSPTALDRLVAYPWPGNVRELKNVIRQAVLVAGSLIQPEHLRMPEPDEMAAVERWTAGTEPLPLREMVRRATAAVERKAIGQVLERTGGNKARAARLLHIDYKTLYRKARAYGLWSRSGRRRPRER